LGKESVRSQQQRKGCPEQAEAIAVCSHPVWGWGRS
jgi:hypothetical protein